MPYMKSSTLPRVGFRPVGQTNPRRAANLSGLDAEATWKLGQMHVFDPWQLHGLGQLHPFNEDPGGWLLHGDFLGDVVEPESPAGSILVYTASLTSGLLLRQDLSQLAEQLDVNANLHVIDSSVSAQGWLGRPAFTLKVRDGIGHALISDITHVIDHNATEILGDVTGSDTVIVQKPGGGGRTDDGPGPDGTPIDPLQWLMHNAGLIALGIGALVLLPPLIKKL